MLLEPHSHRCGWLMATVEVGMLRRYRRSALLLATLWYVIKVRHVSEDDESKVSKGERKRDIFYREKRGR